MAERMRTQPSECPTKEIRSGILGTACDRTSSTRRSVIASRLEKVSPWKKMCYNGG